MRSSCGGLFSSFYEVHFEGGLPTDLGVKMLCEMPILSDRSQEPVEAIAATKFMSEKTGFRRPDQVPKIDR